MISDPQEAQQAVTAKKGSPWSGLGRILTKSEWISLKQWRADNPESVLRQGDVGFGGLIFLVYKSDARDGERWCRKEIFDRAVLRMVCKNKTRPKGYNRTKSLEYIRKAHLRPGFTEKHKAYHREYGKRWSKNNRPLLNARDQARRALEIEQLHPDRNNDVIKRIYRHACSLRSKHGHALDVDHIIPLTAGGYHKEGNLQILPSKINRSKGGNPFWMTDGPYLDWRDVPRDLWPEKLRLEYERLIALHPKPVHAIRTGFKGQRPVNQLAA